MALQALVAALFAQSYGVYAAFWMAEFGWSRTTVSLAYSLHRTESALLGPLHGWLLGRVPPRRVVLVGVVLLGCGFLALSSVRGFGTFIAVYLVMAVGASLAGILSLTTVVVNWFERYRARAMALLATGLTVGGLAIPIVTLLMVTYGWRAVALVSGLLVLAVGIPASRLMHRDPESLGQRPDGDVPNDVGRGDVHTAPARASITARAAVRTKAFWLLSVGHATGITVVSALMVHYVLLVSESTGVTVTIAATMLTATTVAAMLGQLVGGVLGDRVDKRHLAAAGMVGHGAAVAVLAYASSPPVALAASLLHGLSWGVRGPLMSAMRADYFGRASYPMIMGISSMVVTLGSVGGPVLAGALADASGHYRSALLALAVVAMVGAVAFVLLAPPQLPQHQEGSP